ncbi:RNF111 [Mytilus edulis]|uniref:RNF111 n=1 Tax=Mytilus edulis TaxID=6550 RepID=A0A8S3VM48_MYTED|nr:RNF111 [Mytilus edulis]
MNHMHLPPHCVPNLLSAGKRCFCHSRTCVDDILSSHISAITTTAQPVTTKAVQVHNHEFRCGGYVCHRHQKCVIEENRHKQLHFRCEDHSDHHTPHCVPNLLSAGKHCLCISRSCVDNILISLVSGHEVSGLICADHDDHFCHSNQLHECRHVPDVNEHCFCSTQECVFGIYILLFILLFNIYVIGSYHILTLILLKENGKLVYK